MVVVVVVTEVGVVDCSGPICGGGIMGGGAGDCLFR